ncbi:hypothetical protein BGZ94_003936 [Podila epigama]|nr:hypothetical protein BGZ94_003936 [Podila epigama]
MTTVNQYSTIAGPQSPPVVEYAFPSVLQFLQTEWRRFERDRNEWDIEKAEMKARIAFLEGEKRGLDSSKVDLMKRVKMLEYALRQERSNAQTSPGGLVSSTATTSTTTTTNMTTLANKSAVSAQPFSASPPSGVTYAHSMNNISKAQKRMSTSSTNGQNMTQVSPTTATAASSRMSSLDLLGRAKSREYLRVCLQEISYLTSSVPQSIALSMPPPPSRLARQESEKRAAPGTRQNGAQNRNRNSDYYPAQAPSLSLVPPPPPLISRANSVPVPTLHSLSGIRPVAGSPPLDVDKYKKEKDAFPRDATEDMTLQQLPPLTQQQQQLPQQHEQHEQHPALPQQPKNKAASISKHRRVGSVDLDFQSITAKSAPPKVVVKEIPISEESLTEEEEEGAVTVTAAATTVKSNDRLQPEEDEEPITVMHSPLSVKHWHTQLQKAGQQLKDAHKSSAGKADDEAQLSKDVQDKFKISPEKLNRMVKEWDRSKQDNGLGQKSIRKKKGRDSAMLDELASLQWTEFEVDETGGKTVETEDSVPRWRHKASLKRHLDAVTSLAFHPLNKSILTGSEDGTMRYWNLESLLRESRKSVCAEIEPVHIYRGHTRSITSVTISADKDICFSSSLDWTVRSWKLVPMDKEPYTRGDRTIPLVTYSGHTDVVWDIRLFPISISSSQLLASISADGTLKIWDTETRGPALKSSWGYHGTGTGTGTGTGAGPAPTSVDFCPTDLKKVVVSYTNSVVKLFDIETGQSILDFKSNETYDGTSATQINKIVCHPTMPVLISGHEDRYIRFFDLNSGGCSFSMLSHLNAVSSLDVDAAGLVLCSGGHDGSIRLWDLASSNRACLQEIPGHRRRGDEGVCAVQYHPTQPKLLATGGADTVAKLWTWS